MINIFDITELKYLIINFLDIKSIGRMICIDQSIKRLVESMPIYQELITCLPFRMTKNFHVEIFINSCRNNCLKLLQNILTNYYDRVKSIINDAFVEACKHGHLTIIKYL